MKRSLIFLLILCFTCSLLFGCNSTPEDTTPTEAKDPIWGKGYYVSFNAYTVHSGHPSDEFHYCLTDNNTLVNGSPAWDIKMESWEFDPEAFTALCTDYGYWQDKFSPEYICENIDAVWKGSFEESNWYLLKLTDGMLMVAAGVDYITSVQIIEEKGTQAEYFSYWNDQWLPRQFEDDKAPYEKWRELYRKYK